MNKQQDSNRDKAAVEGVGKWSRMHRFSLILRCCILSWLMLLTGCDTGPTLVPISGQVRIDGKPLEQGVVMVWVKDYRSASGAIGKDGRFSLRTHDPGDGCVPGEHPVTIRSQRTLPGDASELFIPERYGDPDRSGLTIVVDKSRDDWVIDLTWKGDAHQGPYILQ